MLEIEVIKEIINELPIVGDSIIQIIGNQVTYKSGGKLEVDESKNLKLNDKIIHITFEFDEIKEELYIGVLHVPALKNKGWINSIIDRNIFLRRQRHIKIKKIMSK